MKEKSHKKGRIILITALTVLFAMYLAGVWYFHSHLLPGSRVNGIRLDRKTAGEAENALSGSAGDIVLYFPEGKKEVIPAGDIELTSDFGSAVKSEMQKQNEFLWFLPGRGAVTASPVIHFNKDKLTQMLLELPEMQEETTRDPENAYMVIEKGVARIEPEKMGTRLLSGPVQERVLSALEKGEKEIRLDQDRSLLQQPTLTAESERLVNQTEKINYFLSTTVTYWFYDGTSETVDRENIAHWLTRSEDGIFYYINNQELKRRCSAYVQLMAMRRNVTYEEVLFRGTLLGQRWVPAEQEKFGYIIDVEAETEELYKNLQSRLSTVRKPVYFFAREFNDFIRDDYVEVDLANQKVFYYRDGGLFLTCDCVTGLYSNAGRWTPVGVYSVQTKGRNVVLRGRPDENGVPEYESFVNYWMPFYRGYGLHDASWQSAFGGERYKSHGSRGCVNLDYASASRIYSAITVGTPVIVVGEEAYY